MLLPGGDGNYSPWRKQIGEEHGEEITPSDGIPSTIPSRSVEQVCAGIHAGQGLAPRALAAHCDFDPMERPFFGYSKPSQRD